MTILDICGPFQASWTKALDKLGWCNTDDPIEGEKLGDFACGLTIDAETKSRGYAASAYYTLAVTKRSNLTILTETVVRKIITKAFKGLVVDIGVKVRANDGVHHEILARKEVILSAGTINRHRSLNYPASAKKNCSRSMVLPWSSIALVLVETSRIMLYRLHASRLLTVRSQRTLCGIPISCSLHCSNI